MKCFQEEIKLKAEFTSLGCAYFEILNQFDRLQIYVIYVKWHFIIFDSIYYKETGRQEKYEVENYCNVNKHQL